MTNKQTEASLVGTFISAVSYYIQFSERILFFDFVPLVHIHKRKTLPLLGKNKQARQRTVIMLYHYYFFTLHTTT